jgi:protein-disulfide isomerase
MIDSSESNQSPHSALLPLYMGLAFLGTLAVGLILGFLARPLIIPDQVEVVEVVATAAISPVQSVAQANVASPDAENKAGDVASVTAAGTDAGAPSQATDAAAVPTPTIMEFLMSDARHIQGAADAPVTIIEFSDFK